ncbi:hypothetical protein Dimus_010134 [Dionaea muscipula]
MYIYIYMVHGDALLAPLERTMILKPMGNEFPVGMRVLALDDDHISLMNLKTMLRRCQYHVFWVLRLREGGGSPFKESMDLQERIVLVSSFTCIYIHSLPISLDSKLSIFASSIFAVTTTRRAVTALQMLRDSMYKFDLVITEVHLSDMGGLQLLEHVVNEMDLPVVCMYVLLSSDGDSKLVMKGITLGASDYLVKPVQLKELKVIWQHVIRRRISNPIRCRLGIPHRALPKKTLELLTVENVTTTAENVARHQANELGNGSSRDSDQANQQLNEIADLGSSGSVAVHIDPSAEDSSNNNNGIIRRNVTCSSTTSTSSAFQSMLDVPGLISRLLYYCFPSKKCIELAGALIQQPDDDCCSKGDTSSNQQSLEDVSLFDFFLAFLRV